MKSRNCYVLCIVIKNKDVKNKIKNINHINPKFMIMRLFKGKL